MYRYKQLDLQLINPFLKQNYRKLEAGMKGIRKRYRDRSANAPILMQRRFGCSVAGCKVHSTVSLQQAGFIKLNEK
jgi:hypothetical protein